MKILYISTSEPYPGTHAGFTHVHNLLQFLTSEGIEVVLLAGPPEPALPMPEQIEGLVVWHISSTGPAERNLKTLIAGLRALRKDKFDLIHERMGTVSGAGTLLARLRGLPHILEVNDPFLELNTPDVARPFLGMTKRFLFSAADGIITQTPQIREAIRGIVPDKRVFVIPNGANPEAFPMRELPGENRVGFMGSFMPWHGVHLLIKAFERVSEEMGEAELMLIGEPGRMRERIVREIRKRGLTARVRITGRVSSEGIPELLSRCSVLVAPFAPETDPVRKKYYRTFGFWWSPLKIFEYMAAGRPVVAPEIGMIPTYIRGAGITYPPGDDAGLAEAIISILRDRERAERMGKAGRERVERIYNWRMVGHMTAMAYLNVMEGRKGR